MVTLDHAWLQHVEKPARYTGGEWNSVVKNHANMAVTFALAFPDVYEVSMSHLGIKILYALLNDMPDVAAERVFAPWVDMEKEMRERNIPLFSLESKTEAKNFDFLGFTLQYEMSYSNIVNMLDLAGIPLYSKDRDLDMPLIVAGGPCVYNIEPIADYFDIASIGESEEWLPEILAIYKEEKAKGFPEGKKGLLKKLVKVPGTYIPSFYEPNYDAEGNFTGLTILEEEAPANIEKRLIEDMENAPYPVKPIVPYLDVVHDRAVLELFRGCTRGCRFCQAGMLYRPVRERTPEKLVQMAKDMIQNTGYNEISLMSLSSADYSKLPELVDLLMEEFKGKRVSVSLPSLRIDAFSIDIAKKVQQVRKSGLTFAPEAGSQRMRDVINKGVSEEDLMAACKNAFESGWHTVKLYFMMGLPTETDEDVAGIADLAYKVLDLHREITGKNNGKVTVSVSFFVPKSHTPYQWYGQQDIEEIHRKQRYLKTLINNRNISYHYHDGATGYMEAAFARGDRRLAKVVEEAVKMGAKFDGWTEYFSLDLWLSAFEKCGLDPAYFARRDRSMDEVLPWDHLDDAVNKPYLRREWERAVDAALTPDCRRLPCNGCNVCPELDTVIIDYNEGGKVTKPTYGLRG